MGAVVVRTTSDGEATPATTSSAAAATTARASAASTSTTAPAAAAPATTGPAVPGPLLAGAPGTELVLLEGDDRLVRVDLATGASTAVGVGDLRFEGTRAMVLADHLVVTGGQLRTVSLVDAEARIEAVDLPGWPTCAWTPGDADRVWALPCPGPAGAAEAVEFSVSGHAETARRSFPDGVELVDAFVPGVGFVVQAGSGIYRIDGDGTATRVASGRVMAVVGHWVARFACDDALRCGTDVVDLLTGTSRPLVLGDGLDARRIDPLGSVASPTGDRAVVVAYGDRPVLAVLDAVAGTVERIPTDVDVVGSWSAAWSGDGAWLFLQGQGDVRAWRVGEPRTVGLTGLPGDRLLGARG